MLNKILLLDIAPDPVRDPAVGIALLAVVAVAVFLCAAAAISIFVFVMKRRLRAAANPVANVPAPVPQFQPNNPNQP